MPKSVNHVSERTSGMCPVCTPGRVIGVNGMLRAMERLGQARTK